MKKIGILIPYFGKFPEWSDLYFETLKRNSSIDFIFFTDCETEKYTAPNIFFNKISFEDYVKLVNSKIDVSFRPQNAYKLCDLRPLFGLIHQDILEPYDFYGWADMDILFGDIRSFYTDEILSSFDVLSTHSHIISGLLALFRNNKKNRLMYKKIYSWKEALEKDEFVGIDEHGLTIAYAQTFFDKINQKFGFKINNFLTRFFSEHKKKRLYIEEQYPTPFVPRPWLDGTLQSDQPDVWYYQDGVITNERDKPRKFLCLHFMNFKSSRWRYDGTLAPWEGRKRICFARIDDMVTGIVINNDGINFAS